MGDVYFALLPEAFDVSSVLEDPEFTEVTGNGEIYTLYRVVRLTHEASEHPAGWTHVANVTRVRSFAIGTALLRIANKVIEDARVTLSGQP